MFIIENHMITGVTEINLLTVKVPDGIIAISDNAFRDCKKLQIIDFPESLTSIGNHAFSGCESLTKVNLSTVTSIGEQAFFGCSSLTEVTLGEKIGYLCKSVFEGCTSLHAITLPHNITYIGCECFKDCTSLAQIDLGEVMEIDNNAFEHCSELCTLILPKSLMHISQNAFSFCSSLSSVMAQNRFIDIDETAFENTVNLIFKAVQFSTSYEYVQLQGYRFVPAVVEERHRVITSEQVAALKAAKIMFQMKALSGEKAIIRYDEGQRMEIEKVIGRDDSIKQERREEDG